MTEEQWEEVGRALCKAKDENRQRIFSIHSLINPSVRNAAGFPADPKTAVGNFTNLSVEIKTWSDNNSQIQCLSPAIMPVDVAIQFK